MIRTYFVPSDFSSWRMRSSRALSLLSAAAPIMTPANPHMDAERAINSLVILFSPFVERLDEVSKRQL
jgi:hypothetical protein